MNLRLLLILPLLLASCSSLPEIRPSAVVAGKVIACPSPFVARKTLFIHAVEAAAAGETNDRRDGGTRHRGLFPAP